jgi:hypothetical protein
MATINPFQAPINYASDVQSPFEAALGGFKLGTDVATLEAAQQKRQLEIQALEQAKKGQTELANLFKNPNATAADYEAAIAFLPKDQAAIVTQGFERKTKEQQQNDLRMGGEVYSAVKAGNLEVATQRLTDKANALRNSGRENEAKEAERAIELIKLNPTGAQATIGLYMARLPGGTVFLDAADKALATNRAEALQPSALSKSVANAAEAVSVAEIKAAEAKDTPARIQAEKELREAQAKEAKIKASFEERQQLAALDKINWDVKNLKSQINDRVAKLNLDRQTTQATVAEKLSAIQQRLTDIPESARKLVNESATLAATSKQAATQYNDLASRIESAGGGKGKLTSATEWFAANLGQQDAWTQIRNEYTRVRNSVAIKALPPGVATDKDIELALKGIPPETANAATLASFLRGTAKLQDIDSSINNAKTDWLSQNNGLLTRAKAPFIAGDYAAKAGETFNDFAQRIVGDVSSKYRSPAQIAEDKRQQLISQIPTNQTPVAAPTQTSIEAQADAILRGGR